MKPTLNIPAGMLENDKAVAEVVFFDTLSKWAQYIQWMLLLNEIEVGIMEQIQIQEENKSLIRIQMILWEMWMEEDGKKGWERISEKVKKGIEIRKVRKKELKEKINHL